jgi:hypothetical protein
MTAALSRSKSRRIIAASALLVCAALAAVLLGCSQSAPPPAQPAPGKSGDLTSTIVVPTLDTPLMENKSALWCCTFQMAWDELKNNVVKAPILLADAEAVSERLNKGAFAADNLTEGSYYTTAGYNLDGIHDRIRAEMKRRFPDEPEPALGDNPSNGFTAFAFLKAGLAFDRSFPNNPDAFPFKSGDGNKTSVNSMGYLKDTDQTVHLPQQISVLYCSPWGKGRKPDSFVLDLDRKSKPNQLLLAAVERKSTLAETYADVEKKIAENRERKREDQFTADDRLIVPCVKAHLEHHFKELENKYFLEPPDFKRNRAFIGTAFQSIEFQLDGTGVQLKSTALGNDKDKGDDKDKDKPDVRDPKDFFYDRPFLLILKKRDAKQPFFLMWVDNAELLEKR